MEKIPEPAPSGSFLENRQAQVLVRLAFFSHVPQAFNIVTPAFFSCHPVLRHGASFFTEQPMPEHFDKLSASQVRHDSIRFVTPASAPSYIHNEIKISMDVQVASVADSS